MSAAAIDIRLRTQAPDVLLLPWDEPLAEWDPMAIAFRDVPVGMSRHLVRFVETGDGLLAIKEAPDRLVEREYAVLRALQERRLPAVRPLGVVLRGADRDGLLVTRFLEHSWQFRRLFMRLPIDNVAQRDRLLAAMAGLLVELHRRGVFWGDGSLANTLFVRAGQVVEAHLVDAETSEVHSLLSDGQRRHDLGILVENVAGGLVDIANRTEIVDDIDAYVEAAQRVEEMYGELWDELHRDLVIDAGERWRIASHLQRLHELGYAVDEVRIEGGAQRGGQLVVTVCVAGRDHHSEELRRLTGLDVRAGQAAILLNDLCAFASGRVDAAVARRWRSEILEPGLAMVRDLPGRADAIQALCDLLEVRWLLSESAGHDVGGEVALDALWRREVPPSSSAAMSVLEPPTVEMRLDE